MRWLRRVIGGATALARRERAERELDEELRACLEAAVEEKVSRGLDRGRASRLARLELGLVSVESVKDRVRDVGWETHVEGLWRDVRYALRYVIPFWFLLTPVIYPLAEISDRYRWLVALNPMAPIVEAFKWGTLREGTFPAVTAAMSFVLVLLTMVTGLWFFNREESASVDKL